MPIFSLLADPAGYIPCSTENMHVDHEYREYWLTHFEHHFESVLKLAVDNYGPASISRADACRKDFVAMLHAIHQDPHILPRLDLLILDTIRQEKLIAHGIPDPFEKTKSRENAASLPLYPQIIKELDSHRDDREALLLAVIGVFAGNIFDLGAGATTKMFAEKSPDFLAVRQGLEGKRPWLVDQFDAFAAAVLSRNEPYRQALFFCDNAGPDFVLGVVPFCRILAKRGTRVILAANRLPALNDMTIAEVNGLLPQIQAMDPIFDQLVRQGMIRAINSGGIAPLIDLREVSEEVNREAESSDLVILEGMGRAIETNFEAKFTVDALKLAMIKEEIVARRHGGKNFDTICRFDAGIARRSR